MSLSSRVLSVQSHVASGYVGNRAAVFPMQLLGFEVDFVNSVEFSNHTKYPTLGGPILSLESFENIIDGLEKNGLLEYDYLLTGYIGSKEFLGAITTLWCKIKKANPSARFICDPVLGDDDKYYVPKELVELFKTEVIPQSFMISPNWFEASILTNITITTEYLALKALGRLHQLGPRVVALTSTKLDENKDNKMISCFLSLNSQGFNTINGGNEKHYYAIRISMPFIDGHYTGVGDATTALLLSWFHINGGDLLKYDVFFDIDMKEEAVIELLMQIWKKVLSTMNALIEKTKVKKEALLKAKKARGDAITDALKIHATELNIIQSKRGKKMNFVL